MKATNKSITITAGKRKMAVAKVRASEGQGHVTYNGTPYGELQLFHRLALSEPIHMAKEILGELKANFKITTSGGGKEGQIQAARLGLAKAIIAHSKSADLKKAFLKYDRALLVADTRRKETYKPGDSKARAKRQKSYR